MSGSKQIFESNQADDQAADKALKSVSTNLIEQLNLFDTTLHLYTMDGLTSLERERLQNIYITELERKQYLMTIVIPGKGPYKGMTMLRRALKETGQNEILNILEQAYENAVCTNMAEKSDKTEASYPVQATVSGYYDSHTAAVCSATGLDTRCLERATRSGNSSLNNVNDNVSLHFPVEQSSQPQSDDVSLHFPVQPQSDNVDSLVEHQSKPQSENVVSLHSPVQPLSDNVTSLVEQQPVTVEQELQSQSDDVSSQKSLEQKPRLQTDNVLPTQSLVSMEQRIHSQSDNASSLKSPVVTEEAQLQSNDGFSLNSQSDDFPSHKSLKQQSQPQSNDATSLPVTVPQPQSHNGAPQSDNGASPSQQQSGSQVTPYFKFRLPPAYSGTVTFAVIPSSYSSAGEIPHSSTPNKSKPPEQDDVLATTPKNFNNSGVVSSVDVIFYFSVYILQHENDILKSIDQFECDYSVMKFVFVGDTATGKTSLIERYTIDKFSDCPTSTVSLIVFNV